jgi:hypothetical protein
MPEETTTTALDDPKNLHIQAREWMVERVAWFAVAGVLIAALVGLLGPGPLGKRTLASSDGRLSIQFYLVERYEAPSELRIRFRPLESETTMVRLTLSRSFADETSTESFTPEPEVVEMTDDQIIYSFRLSELKEGRIVHRYQHNDFGLLRYTVGLLHGPSVDITQFVCP